MKISLHRGNSSEEITTGIDDGITAKVEIGPSHESNEPPPSIAEMLEHIEREKANGRRPYWTGRKWPKIVYEKIKKDDPDLVPVFRDGRFMYYEPSPHHSIS